MSHVLLEKETGEVKGDLFCFVRVWLCKMLYPLGLVSMHRRWQGGTLAGLYLDPPLIFTLFRMISDEMDIL